MITGISTIFLVITLILSILYGLRLIRIEKVDAVFGNPERTRGGYHWVVAGSCSILLLWLYFSWDIARAFYPQSANEICQAAKVRASLVPIKYIFPIEERTLKSTSVIYRETQNIDKLKNELQNSNLITKHLLIQFLNQIRMLIVSLANEKNL